MESAYTTAKRRAGSIASMRDHVCERCGLTIHCNNGAFQSHIRHCAMALERLWSKVDKNGPGGCWVWTSYRNERGYGLTTLPGGLKNVRAHRHIYELLRGPLKDGEFLLHKCDVRHCVNPDHMFIGDNAANQADRRAKGRKGTRYQPVETLLFPHLSMRGKMGKSTTASKGKE